MRSKHGRHVQKKEARSGESAYEVVRDKKKIIPLVRSKIKYENKATQRMERERAKSFQGKQYFSTFSPFDLPVRNSQKPIYNMAAIITAYVYAMKHSEWALYCGRLYFRVSKCLNKWHV